MPELPEVETYVRELTPLLRGRQVLGAQVTWPRTIALPGAEDFVAQIAGQRFAEFGRRGKYMLLGLESGQTLIVHLRMTGHLLAVAGDAPVDAHTHVVMRLDDDRKLIFQDSRKFGRLWLVSDPAPVLAHLGPEPFAADFTPDYLAARLHGRQSPIKTLLLDQRLVAGIGNIYADRREVCAAPKLRRCTPLCWKCSCWGLPKRAAAWGEAACKIIAVPAAHLAAFKKSSRSSDARASPARSAARLSPGWWSHSAAPIFAPTANPTCNRRFPPRYAAARSARRRSGL
jgi:hypothetical protein